MIAGDFRLWTNVLLTPFKDPELWVWVAFFIITNAMALTSHRVWLAVWCVWMGFLFLVIGYCRWKWLVLYRFEPTEEPCPK